MNSTAPFARRSAAMFVLAAAALAAVLVWTHHQTSAQASDRADHPLVPTKVTTHGMSQWAEYGPSRPRPRSTASRHQRISAHAAQVEQDQAFSVLRTPQSASAASDPILRQIARHQGTIDIARARPLDSDRHYWLLPTRDGNVCVGMKTSGAQTFIDACGYDDVVTAGGLAMTSGDALIGLIPDGAMAVHDQDGRPVSMHGNAFQVDAGSKVSFVLHGQTHHLGG